MNRTAKLIMVTAASLFIGIASVTFAEGVDKNDNPPRKMDSCLHQKTMARFHGDMGMFSAGRALSKEQIEKLKAERTEFFNATRDLRQELKSKRLALKSELAKVEPDAKTAMKLQNDISALNTTLGQKRVEHLLAMKKIAPYGNIGQLRDGREGSRGGRFRRM